jgi:alpha-galactosidase
LKLQFICIICLAGFTTINIDAITTYGETNSSAQSGPVAARQTGNLSGTWVAKMKTPMGEMEIVYELKVVDGRITGKQVLPFGDSPIVDGTVSGDTFRFTVQLDSFGRQTKREVTGKIAGDSIVLTPAFPAPPPDAGPEAMGPPPPASSGPPGAPGGAGPGAPPPFQVGEVTAHRGTPTPSYRAPSVDYSRLPKIDLPQIRDLPFNGLAKTPPMGWNSWNKFQTHIDDTTVRAIADAIVTSGMKEAGYQYVIIDDGWQGARDSDGTLSPNPNFPDMKALAAYVHSKGLKIGIYSSPGPRTCGGFEGSYGHEEQDARMYASWGMDYLKYDWCSASRVWKDADMRAVYQKMGEALSKTGRPIAYALCQYGRAEVQTWGPHVAANLWRTTADIRDQYDSMLNIGFAQSRLSEFAGPGHWNDPDMLEIGNGGMSTDEYKTHFSLWAMVAAPLISGNDLQTMTPDIKDILANSEVIAVDQDALGAGGKEVYSAGAMKVWSKPLASGDVVVAVFNTAGESIRAMLSITRLGLSGKYSARDLWTHEEMGALPEDFSVTVPVHGVAMLRLKRRGGPE